MTGWRFGRVAILAARQLVGNTSRFLLLTAMVASGLLIFLLVSGLSRASEQQLRDAIQRDLGTAGLYDVVIPTDLGVPVEELVAVAVAVLDRAGADSAVVLADLGPTDLSCPERPGTRPMPAPLYVALHASSPDRLAAPSARDSVDDQRRSPRCLLGMPVPGHSLSDLDAHALLDLDEPPTILGPTLLAQASLAVGPPQRLHVLVRLPIDGDHSGVLESELVNALTPFAQRTGLAEQWTDHISVAGRDQGAAIRRAEEGVRLLYRMLAWGILALGGIGVLVAQLMTAQSRTWFFGLARVSGATPADIVAIVVLEVAALVFVAGSVAVALAMLLRHAVESWSTTAFGTPFTLLDASTVPSLVFGLTTLVLIGAAYPALRAARSDPLAALEH